MSQTLNHHLLNEVSRYVTAYLNRNLPEEILFHDLEHIRYVVEKAKDLGQKCGLNEQELIMVQICAWFHDIGFSVDPARHEEISARMAEDFLRQKQVDENLIKQIKNCILSTQIPQKPQDKVSKVLCDADLMHLTEDDYLERIQKMRKEQSHLTGKEISPPDFHKKSVAFFEAHNYHTGYGKTDLEPKKNIILQQLKDEIKMLEKDQLENPEKEEKKDKKKKKSKKKKTYSRGVESMFKNTARMQINLSSIADKKSNILISVNAIIISITTTLLISQYEESPNIIFPAAVLLTFSLITIIFAILSTRPNISSGKFDKEDVENDEVNLLFFGNFYDMDLEEYEWAMRKIMKNDKKLYSALIRDQHSLGKVLAKKYKLLRIAYNVFMAGIIISVLAFLLTFIRFKIL